MKTLWMSPQEYWPVYEHEEPDCIYKGDSGKLVTIDEETFARWERVEAEWKAVQQEKAALMKKKDADA